MNTPVPGSEEAPEKTKAEMFAENPDRFEDAKKCFLLVKRNQHGILVNCVNALSEQEWLADPMTLKDVHEALHTLRSYTDRELNKKIGEIEQKIREASQEFQNHNGKKKGFFPRLTRGH